MCNLKLIQLPATYVLLMSWQNNIKMDAGLRILLRVNNEERDFSPNCFNQEVFFHACIL